MRGAVKMDDVGVNFNRLTGEVSVSGINAPTEKQISQCKAERDWGCNDWLVAVAFKENCSIVVPKF